MTAEEFNQNAKPSFESLRADAELKSAARLLIRHPSHKVYERFAASIDAFLEAFREKYPSLQAYIDEKESGLKPLLAQKGIAQQGCVVDIDEGARQDIEKLNKQVYTKDSYIDRDSFAEYFVVRLPSVYTQVAAHIAKMPDAPKPTASNPQAPGN